MTWKTAKLRDIAVIERMGINPTDIQTGTLYVGLENLDKSGGFDGVGQVSNGDLASTKFVFDDRHILYGKLRPYLSKISRPSFSGVCSTDILPITTRAVIDRDYLFHFLRLPKTIELATTRSAGANLPRISPRVLEDFDVPVPPLDEQKRIAAVLDKADELRQKRRQAIKKLDELLQSVFLDMFGDPVSNPKGWPIKSIGELPLFISDGNYSSKYPRADEFCESGVPFIRSNNLKNRTVISSDIRFISREKHNELRKGHLKMNDVLITTRGDIGYSALVPREFEGANINAQIVLLRPTNDEIDPVYLMWVLSDSGIKKRAQSLQTGSALKQLPVGKLAKLNVPLPSKELQQNFMKTYRKAASLQQMLQTSCSKIDLLFASLQQRAFNSGF